jgi:hypothetical protein
LAKLERWQELALWYYRDVQPIIVDASETLEREFDIEGVRDLLWKTLESARIQAAERIRDEEIESAYVELYAFDSSVYERFRTTLAKLKAVDKSIYGSFLQSVQAEVMAFEGRREGYTPALLGNALRRTCHLHERELAAEIERSLRPLHDFLVDVVSMDDATLLRRRRSLP